MKVYISCNGLGLGHVGRSLAYANKLRDRGDEVVFASWGPAVKFAKGEGYRCYRLPAVDWYDRDDGSLDFFRTVLYSPLILYRMLKLLKEERQIIEKEAPSVVVSDSNFGHIAAKKLGIPSIFLTHQITFRQGGKLLDKIFGFLHKSNFLKADKICINDLKYPDNIYSLSVLENEKAICVGPLIRVNPGIQQKKNKKKMCFILVSGPKQSPYAFEKEILGVEDELHGMEDWEFVIKTPSEIEGKGNIRYVRWLDSVHEYLCKCDVFVSRSGYSTVCDALAYARKSIFIPQINQREQEIIADYLDKKQMAVALEQGEMKKLPGLIKESYENTKMQEKLDEFSSLIGKNKGAENIIRVIDDLK
ncbi:MAG: hypothetical protein KAR87_04820 [Candidatus Aenigmarchaeota archaeon]|nr:hypothetical protein [Candidatus Aenigmarchaeota archaeon]